MTKQEAYETGRSAFMEQRAITARDDIDFYNKITMLPPESAKSALNMWQRGWLDAQRAKAAELRK